MTNVFLPVLALFLLLRYNKDIESEEEKMSGHYSKEELNQLDKQSLILLVTAMQDQLQQMNDSLNRLTEQIAAANQYRFGRHSEKMNDFDSQLSIFDLLNEAEHTIETASDLAKQRK